MIICRGCLTETGPFRDLFCEDSISLLQKYISFVAIQAEACRGDGYPQHLCANCEKCLIGIQAFREQCLKSLDKIRSLKVDIKTEYLESDLEDKKPSTEEITCQEAKLESCNTEVSIESCDAEDYTDSSCDENSSAPLPLNDPLSSHEERTDLSRACDSSDKIVHKKNKSKLPQVDVPFSRQRLNLVSSELVTNLLITFENEKNNTCQMCNFKARTTAGLNLHISYLHRDVKDTWCNICAENFDNLVDHQQKHPLVNMLCPFCDKQFNQRGHFKEHLLSHSGEKQFRCNECGQCFSSIRRLRLHKIIHQSGGRYECGTCGKRFMRKYTLSVHYLSHQGLKPYTCKTCDKSYSAPSNLVAHCKKENHSPGDKNPPEVQAAKALIERTCELNIDDGPVTSAQERKSSKLCSVCGKTYMSSSKFLYHMRTHSGESPYSCSLCSKTFYTNYQLVDHKRTHTGEKPFACDVCGKRFTQSSTRNTHMKLHTGKTISCKLCDKKFCRASFLQLHMRSHTGEKPYDCSICGFSFKQHSHMKEHMKTHSSERPFKCNVCYTTFKHKSSMNAHLKTHSEDSKPHKCRLCQFSCRRASNLVRHMHIHNAKA